MCIILLYAPIKCFSGFSSESQIQKLQAITITHYLSLPVNNSNKLYT